MVLMECQFPQEWVAIKRKTDFFLISAPFHCMISLILLLDLYQSQINANTNLRLSVFQAMN